MRESGILMPVASLPGSYGIGGFGRSAYDFVDFLSDAGQSVWQILPLSPTGYGDSPYQSCSAFAGNPYFIDLDMLADEGLLTAEELAALPWGRKAERIDYEAQYHSRFAALHLAFDRWMQQRPVPGCESHRPDDFYAFCLLNESWLEDYALYMAIKEENGMTSYQEWPDALRLRDPEALAAYAAAHADELEFWRFVQYEFDRQWQQLKTYANESGVEILGDIPIYVAADSADAWAGGPLFEMDEEGRPCRVAGCPPDYFTEDGQLWGNPLYNWEYHEQTGFAWWVGRVRHALRLYDRLRIDHFRGFDTYWAIPADADTARPGHWEQGPGMKLFDALHEALGEELPIIAEDLGEMFDSVRKLLKDSGFPGMKVMQFAFGSGGSNDYLPHNHTRNCVVYPGTHDNTTLGAWLTGEAKPEELRHARMYLGLNPIEGSVTGFLRGVLTSPADLAIIPMADWLGLGAEARINTPGVLGGNWDWRMRDGACTPRLVEKIRALCEATGRTAPEPEEESVPAPEDSAEELTVEAPAAPVAEPEAAPAPVAEAPEEAPAPAEEDPEEPAPAPEDNAAEQAEKAPAAPVAEPEAAPAPAEEEHEEPAPAPVEEAPAPVTEPEEASAPAEPVLAVCPAAPVSAAPVEAPAVQGSLKAPKIKGKSRKQRKAIRAKMARQ